MPAEKDLKSEAGFGVILIVQAVRLETHSTGITSFVRARLCFGFYLFYGWFHYFLPFNGFCKPFFL
jgi:hypothetical protein